MNPVIKLTTKSVNSKHLMQNIDDLVRASMEINDYMWEDNSQLENFVYEVDMCLYELEEENKIIQWDVMCDSRNNKIVAMEKGQFNIIVKYKQFNCLNTTQLIYDITT